MSDQSQGPGWWQASDDKWYPPESHPDYVAPAPPPPAPSPPAPSGAPLGWSPPAAPQAASPQRPSNSKADAAAAKAYAKAERPWYKKKRFMIPLVVVVIAIVASAAGSGDDDKDTTATNDNTEQPAGDGDTNTTKASEDDKHPNLYPDRPDRQKEDQERAIGGPGVELSGYTTTVNTAEFVQSLSSFENSGYIVANVTIYNRDKSSQAFNVFDFKIQSPDGVVEDPTFTSKDYLESGDLVGGGTVTGDVFFDVGDAHGDYYLIYKPDPFDAARGSGRSPFRSPHRRPAESRECRARGLEDTPGPASGGGLRHRPCPSRAGGGPGRADLGLGRGLVRQRVQRQPAPGPGPGPR